MRVDAFKEQIDLCAAPQDALFLFRLPRNGDFAVGEIEKMDDILRGKALDAKQVAMGEKQRRCF